MSPSDNTGHPVEDKPEGLSKYLKRMKTVLRPRSTPKRQSVAAPEATTSSSSKAAAPLAAAAAPAHQFMAASEPGILTDYSVLQQEKARTLFAKYGLTLEPNEWKSPTDLQLTRVTKPVRMRVRRTCHRCQTTFGPDKVCVNCQHPRCKKCPRFPPGQDKPEGERRYHSVSKTKLPEIWARERGVSGFTPHLRYTGNPLAPLSLPSRSGGPDLVRKPVRQRVHRTCHACGVDFVKGSKECENCKHLRCKKCPRIPGKPDKYPNGYPGDSEACKLKPKPERTYKRARQRVHYICHVCSTSYNEGAQACGKCGQAKCAETIRIPPKKVKREPEPEIVQRVEERMATLKIQE